MITPPIPELPNDPDDERRQSAAAWLSQALSRHRAAYAGRGPGSLAHDMAELAMFTKMGISEENYADRDLAAEYDHAPLVVNKLMLN